MKNSDVWASYSFNLKNKAFKDIRPLDMAITPEIEYETSGFWFWSNTEEFETGRYIISLRYDRGPLTFKETSHVYFDEQKDAYAWYNDIFNKVFMVQSKTPPPPPPPPRKKRNTVSKLPIKKSGKTTPLRLL